MRMTSDLEAVIEVRDCLDCLTPRQREAVNLRAAGLKFREIADAMGISAPAAYYLIERAKARMENGNNN